MITSCCTSAKLLVLTEVSQSVSFLIDGLNIISALHYELCGILAFVIFIYHGWIMIIHRAVRNTSYRSLDSVLMLNAPHKIGSITIYSANLRINPAPQYWPKELKKWQVYVGFVAVITPPPRAILHITQAPAPAMVRPASRADLVLRLAASRARVVRPSIRAGTVSSLRLRSDTAPTVRL